MTFKQVKTSNEAFHLNVKGYIASLGTASSQMFGRYLQKWSNVLILCEEMSWGRVKAILTSSVEFKSDSDM